MYNQSIFYATNYLLKYTQQITSVNQAFKYKTTKWVLQENNLHANLHSYLNLLLLTLHMQKFVPLTYYNNFAFNIDLIRY